MRLFTVTFLIPKIRLFVLSFLVMFSGFARAEENLFSANTPSGLEIGDTIAALNHGFASKIVTNGKLEEKLPENGFGFRVANAGVLLRSRVWRGFEVRAHTASRPSEYAAGGSYSLSAEPFSALVGLEGFTVLNAGVFRKNIYAFTSFSTLAFSESFFVPSVGFGYDGFHNLGAAVFGVSIPITYEHAVTAEYHARIKPEKRNSDIGKADSWNVGYRWTSGRHQFAALFSNTSATNERQANMGSENNDVNMSFRITRFFSDQ